MDATISNEIQMKRCPRCSTTIRRCLRYSDVIKQQLQDISKVKAEMRKKTICGLEEKPFLLRNRLYRLKDKFPQKIFSNFWSTLQLDLHKLTNRLRATLLENKIMLTNRFCVTFTKMKNLVQEVPMEFFKEHNLEGGLFLNLRPHY